MRAKVEGAATGRAGECGCGRAGQRLLRGGGAGGAVAAAAAVGVAEGGAEGVGEVAE